MLSLTWVIFSSWCSCRSPGRQAQALSGTWSCWRCPLSTKTGVYVLRCGSVDESSSPPPDTFSVPGLSRSEIQDASLWEQAFAPDAGRLIAQRVDLPPSPRPDDSVDRQPAIVLEALDRRLRASAEDAVNAVGVVAAQRQPLLRPPDGVSG
jgi:hypothetical protein